MSYQLGRCDGGKKELLGNFSIEKERGGILSRSAASENFR